MFYGPLRLFFAKMGHENCQLGTWADKKLSTWDISFVNLGHISVIFSLYCA